jgi:NADP-dependent aldehyde dehydrogenase
MTFRALLAAAKKCNMPDGVVNMIHGVDPEISVALVSHPAIKAVGFTGSLRAGRALMDAAAARPVPIPVYAEMSSLNPIFILPGAIKERSAKIAEGLKNSVTLGAGQFCTKPGLVFAVDEPQTREFIQSLSKLISDVPPATMLHAGIAKSYNAGREKLAGKVTQATPAKTDLSTQASSALFTTTAEKFLADHALAEEVFGPATLLVLAKNAAELERIAAKLEGQLTATIHAASDEIENHHALIDAIQQRAGRLIFNGFPTGVEVNPSMHHGGPYPATSDGRTTSVGTAAIQRFTRAIAYQDWPDTELPEELRESNPRKITRTIDGRLVTGA